MNTGFNWGVTFQALYDFIVQNALGIVLSVAAILVVGQVVVLVVNKIVQDEGKRVAIRKWTRYITAVFIMLWVIILYNSYTSKDTPFYLFVIGLFLAAVAISMRDVFSNIVGWMIIMSGKGYKAGDRIKIGSVAGDVIDIGILRTVLAEIGGWVGADQSTGRLVSIPNSKVLDSEIYNYTEGYDFIWNELKLLVTFESDWKRAESIVMEVAQKDFEQKQEQIQERLKGVRRRYLIRYNYITPKVYIRVAESGVELGLRYMVRARRRRTVEDALSREILERLNSEKDIDFAYPTVRVYREGEELKDV